LPYEKINSTIALAHMQFVKPRIKNKWAGSDGIADRKLCKKDVYSGSYRDLELVRLDGYDRVVKGTYSNAGPLANVLRLRPKRESYH